MMLEVLLRATDLCKLNLVGGGYVIALDDILLVTVDGETTRRESLIAHLILITEGNLLTAVFLVCGPPHGLLLFYLGVG